MVGTPEYAQSVAKVMIVTSTPKPWYQFERLNSHPFVDVIAIECNDVERGFGGGEGMEEDIDMHNASSKILREFREQKQKPTSGNSTWIWACWPYHAQESSWF
jgi:hypothetical protein